MTSRIHTPNQRTNKETQNSSTTSVQGMFQARPFVVQAQRPNQVQQPDLKTSLIQAKHYSHHLNQINSASVSKPEALQPKMEMGKPVQAKKKRKAKGTNQPANTQNTNPPTGTNQPANHPASSSAVGNPTGNLPFSTLKPNNQRPSKPFNMSDQDSQGQNLTAHHKIDFSELNNVVSSASSSSTASQNISNWANPQNNKPNLTQQDIAWNPHNIFMGPLANNRLDDPAKKGNSQLPKLDTHFTSSGTVTPNSHVALKIAQKGGLSGINPAELKKELAKLRNPNHHSPYNPNDWSEPQPGKYVQAGQPSGWGRLDINDRVNYSKTSYQESIARRRRLFEELPFQ